MSYDVVVVGGGIVGLATARALLLRDPARRVAVLEAERTVALHQTGRNSGVVHAGLYYAPGSLQARLCREGRALLLRFADEEGIAHALPGKLVVATRESELARLDALHERGRANGLRGLRRLGRDEAREVEPAVAALRALHVPETGVIDFAAVATALARDVTRRGGAVLLAHEVRRIRHRASELELETTGGDVVASFGVACAGAAADRVAVLAGADVADRRIVPFRGSYRLLAGDARDLVRGLVYPVPDPSLPFLGVHLTRRLDGEVLVGPNAVLALARRRYGRLAFDARDAWATASFPGSWRLLRRYRRHAATEVARDLLGPLYLREVRRYLPDVAADDLAPGPTGTRAQLLARDGALDHDFVIRRSPRMLHVLNAPSPAATASLAIGRHLAEAVAAGA